MTIWTKEKCDFKRNNWGKGLQLEKLQNKWVLVLLEIALLEKHLD